AAYLRPPQVTRIAQQLTDFGIAPDTLTVAELVSQLATILGPGGSARPSLRRSASSAEDPQGEGGAPTDGGVIGDAKLSPDRLSSAEMGGGASEAMRRR